MASLPSFVGGGVISTPGGQPQSSKAGNVTRDTSVPSFQAGGVVAKPGGLPQSVRQPSNVSGGYVTPTETSPATGMPETTSALTPTPQPTPAQVQARLQQQVFNPPTYYQQQYNSGTMRNLGSENLRPASPIITEGYLEAEPTGEIKGTPTYKITKQKALVTETGLAEPGAREQKITSEELQQYKQSQMIETGSEKKMSVYLPAKEKAVNLYENIKSSVADTRLSFLPDINKVDLNLLIEQTDIIPKPFKKEVGFGAGVVQGLYTDIKENPIKNVVLFGASAGIGAAAGAALRGLTFIPKIGGTLSVAGNYALLGAGIYYGGKTAAQIETQLETAKNPVEAGKIFGVASKDIAVELYGFKTGFKIPQQIEGYLRTMGREELILKQGVYPSAPVRKHLELFKENIIPELGEKPVGFHTTPEFTKLTKGGKITPQAGESELPGIYVSTDVSTEFAKIPGSSANQDLSILSRIENFLRSLNKPMGTPGVAALEPERFRYNPARFTNKPTFPGQKYVKGQGYAVFSKPAELGVIDVPGIKGEIESLARPEAGSYNLASKDYFIRIKGVRVPLNKFTAAETLVEGAEFKSGEYNLPKEAGIESGISSYTYLSTPNIITFGSSAVYGSSAPKSLSISSAKSSAASSRISSSISRIVYSSVASVSSAISSGSYDIPSKTYSSASNISKPSGSSLISYTYPSGVSYPRNPSSLPGFGKKRTSKLKQAQAYNVLIRKRRKYIPFATGLTRAEALRRGSLFAQQDIARTFKIIPMGQTKETFGDEEFIPRQDIFRTYQIRQGRRVPLVNTFIQRTEANLKVASERAQLAEARRMKQMFNRGLQ